MPDKPSPAPSPAWLTSPSILLPGVQANLSCFPKPVSLAEPGGAFNRINPSLAAMTKTDFSTKRSICILCALTWFFFCVDVQNIMKKALAG